MPDNAIRLRRLSLGHDQRTIARLARIDRTTLGRIENEQVSAQMDVRRRLCHALGIPWAMHRIFFGPMRGGNSRSSLSRST
jgi:transcriptional regulator with XRE-family HTH domain